LKGVSSDYTIVRFIVDRHGRPINKPFWTLGEAKSERSRLMHEVPSRGRTRSLTTTLDHQAGSELRRTR
jgi:hypothetical protein